MVRNNKKNFTSQEIIRTLNGLTVDVVTEHVDVGLLVSNAELLENNWSACCSPLLIQAATVILHSIMKRAGKVEQLSPKLM